MLNITLRKADFNELKIQDLSKRGVLDSLKIFWERSEAEFLQFLEKNNLEYYKSFSRIEELKNTLNSDIHKLKYLANNNDLGGFSFKAPNLIMKNLTEIKDNEFIKMTIDLKELDDPSLKDDIKDIFLNLKSSSLIDFLDVSEDYMSLIFHKKGAIFYENEPYLCNTRDSNTLLENFKVPRDNNFIMARFLLDFSYKLKENSINESFCVEYSNQEKNIKSVDEIIFWGSLGRAEKEREKQKLQNQESIESQAQILARSEIKQEVNASRNSLQNDSNASVIAKTKETRVQLRDVKTQRDIDAIIQDSITLYTQKELEKTRIRLEKAQKDSKNAYEDLKECLNNGLSILEAIKTIQQKYRNEDTINFASLLFSQDVLNITQKDNEIEELQNELKSAESNITKLNETLETREETISKLKSTLQTKINQLTDIEYKLQKEYEEQAKELESNLTAQLQELQDENEKVISEYEEEIKKVEKEKKAIEQNLFKLENKNEMLEESLKEAKSQLETSKNNARETYRLEIEAERYKEENKELKAKLENLENRLYNILQGQNTQSQDSKIPRSREILG